MKNPGHFKRGAPNPNRLLVYRWFGQDVPIVEAKHELRIQPTIEDLKKSKKGDARTCVFSRACQRMWGSKAVVFFGTTAYVDLLDDRGKRRIERFMVSTEGRRIIRAFDSGKRVNVERGIRLLPPSKGSTTAYRRNYMRRYSREETHKEARKGYRASPHKITRYIEFERSHAGA